MIVHRTRNGKTQTYDLKKKETKYGARKTFRFKEDEYNKFILKCKENNETPSSVIRNLMNKYINGGI